MARTPMRGAAFASLALMLFSTIGAMADMVTIAEAPGITTSAAWMVVGVVAGYMFATHQTPPG